MQDYLFMKLLIVGDSGVGKTSIVNRYFSGFFESSTVPTIGYDFTTKTYSKDPDRLYRMQLWDVAGQERYQAVSKLYARNVSGCLVVCDVSNRTSLENTLRWKRTIEECSDSKVPIPYVLVQNKIDLISIADPEFASEEFLKAFVERNGFAGFFQVSAKENYNLEGLFEFLVEKAAEVVLKTQASIITPGKHHAESLMKISRKYSKENDEDGGGYAETRKKKWFCC